jgi:26S proteasome regulatory subunit T1
MIFYLVIAGTGKTLSARAVANRTDACFIRVIGSELVQKYVGEGARMVRELFTMARSKKACIIFFDEVRMTVRVLDRSFHFSFS